MNYRNKIDFDIIKFPQGFEEENRLFCKSYCCEPLCVMASDDNDSYKNDVTGVVVKKSDITDVVEFKITRCDDPSTDLPLLGYVGQYPQDQLAFGFMFEWKQYLTTFGVGKYNIKIEFTISGVTGGFDYGQFDLKVFSIVSARDSVRIWSEPSSYSLFNEIDFTSSNHADSIRFKGFFGNREPETEIMNLITKGRRVEKVTRENLNKYTLRTDFLEANVTRRLIDFHFLNEDKLFISDHNATNHDYFIFDKQVSLSESPEIEYMEKNRWAKITAVFGDRKLLSKSFYNQE